jgi:hypothetical protein
VIENEPDDEADGWACIKCATPVPDSEMNPKNCTKCKACLLHGERQCWGCNPAKQ